MTQLTTAAGVTLEYETFGDAADPPLLLINGFGTQLISWPRDYCAHLAGGGLYVIAFDNRDTGLSTKFSTRPANVDAVVAAIGRGETEEARRLSPYTLSDMAGDAADLLDGLGIEQAHILGASMGGMIAQTLAIEQPGRCLTLISMMSTTGELEYGQSAPASLAALLEPAPSERQAYIDSSQRWLLWHSRRYPEAEETRQMAAEAWDRGLDPAGTQRQLAAMLASGPRAAGLAELSVPTLVIHGNDDTLIAPSGGERTAELVPGARLVLIDDMGHDRPRALWDVICAPIWEHTGARPR